MKAYIISNSKNGKENIEGIYYLVTEKGEVLGAHFCSDKGYAMSDLYLRYKKKYDEMFENFEVEYLGEDEMNINKFEKLMVGWKL